jgi:hypothetical protein
MFTTSRMTVLRPGQSPPHVTMAALTSSGLKWMISRGPARRYKSPLIGRFTLRTTFFATCSPTRAWPLALAPCPIHVSPTRRTTHTMPHHPLPYPCAPAEAPTRPLDAKCWRRV